MCYKELDANIGFSFLKPLPREMEVLISSRSDLRTFTEFYIVARRFGFIFR